MSPTGQPLTPNDTNAVLLAISALLLIAFAYAVIGILRIRVEKSFVSPVQSSTDMNAQIRINCATVMMEILLTLHILNISLFSALYGGWQALGTAFTRIVPDRVNIIILVWSYLMFFAIYYGIKNDLARVCHDFMNNVKLVHQNDENVSL